jgi:hypothetical protein
MWPAVLAFRRRPRWHARHVCRCLLSWHLSLHGLSASGVATEGRRASKLKKELVYPEKGEDQKNYNNDESTLSAPLFPLGETFVSAIFHVCIHEFFLWHWRLFSIVRCPP